MKTEKEGVVLPAGKNHKVNSEIRDKSSQV